MNERPQHRILHVLGRLNPGGVETWLLNLSRAASRSGIKQDFILLSGEHGAFDEELSSLGAKLHYLPVSAGLLRFSRSFLRCIRQHGPFDIIHSHVHHFTGWILLLSALAGIPVRVAHSHNEISAQGTAPRRLYLAAMKKLIKRFATGRIAVSSEAAASLFGPRWARLGVEILRCGIDFTPIAAASRECNRLKIRERLGLPHEAAVFGTVGRLAHQKNQGFLIKTFAHIRKSQPNAFLVIVGEGDQRDSLSALARHLGIENSVLLVGSRLDVPDILAGVIDVFIMPSLHEGLPLAALEAQAAGKPCLLSTNITPEVVFVPPLVRFLSLEDGPERWAQVATTLFSSSTQVSAAKATDLAGQSQFSIAASLAALTSYYGKQRINGE